MQRNKMFENFAKRVISVILVCVMCITSSTLTDIKLADDSIEIDDFDIPTEEGTYFFDGLSYKKIDESNPFTKEMYDLAVKGLDGIGDYEIDEVIHDPDQCSIYNKDELDALFYVYNHNNTPENNITADEDSSKNNKNGGYLNSWSEDDWKFMRLVLQAYDFSGRVMDTETNNLLLSSPIFSKEGSMLNPDGIMGNYYYVVRLIIPYDNCGNPMPDFVATSVHSCSRDNTEYLDDVFAEEDDFFKSGRAAVGEGFIKGRKYNILDKTCHITVNNNMVVVTRIQQKDNSKHTPAFYDKYLDKFHVGCSLVSANFDSSTYKYSNLGNYDHDDVFGGYFPSNMLFLLDKYVDLRRYYSQRRDREAKYGNPYFKISHTVKKMTSGKAKVYDEQTYFSMCNKFAKANPAVKYCFDWTPASPAEVIYVSSSPTNNNLDVYSYSDLKKMGSPSKSIFKDLKKLADEGSPETFEDEEELVKLMERIKSSYKYY